MNQYITIEYKHWNLCFYLKDKDHREKAPSYLDKGDYWSWCINGEFQDDGFNWNKQ